MTIEQRKISLINWIINTTDEGTIDQIESFRRGSMETLPPEIKKLLTISDLTPESDCIEHTDSKTLAMKK